MSNSPFTVTGTSTGGGGGSGTVNSATGNDLAYYATTGNTVSGLATANNSILTTNGSGVPTWSMNSGLVVWANQSTSTAIVANTGYFTTGGSAVTLTIPATVAFGVAFEISGVGAGGWVLQANTGQTIIFGNQSSSSAGSLASTNQYDGVRIVCSTANTTFKVLYAVGNLTVA